MLDELTRLAVRDSHPTLLRRLGQLQSRLWAATYTPKSTSHQNVAIAYLQGVAGIICEGLLCLVLGYLLIDRQPQRVRQGGGHAVSALCRRRMPVEDRAANARKIMMTHSKETRTVQLLVLSVVVGISGNKIPATSKQVQRLRRQYGGLLVVPNQAAEQANIGPGPHLSRSSEQRKDYICFPTEGWNW
jgi:hypothetical protein